MKIKHEIRMDNVTVSFEDDIQTVKAAEAFVKLASDYATLLHKHNR